MFWCQQDMLRQRSNCFSRSCFLLVLLPTCWKLLEITSCPNSAESGQQLSFLAWERSDLGVTSALNVFVVWEVQNHTEHFTRGQQNVSVLGRFLHLISLYVGKGTFVPTFCVLQFVNLFRFFFCLFFNQGNWCMKEFCQCVWITESLCQVTLCLFLLCFSKKSWRLNRTIASLSPTEKVLMWI